MEKTVIPDKQVMRNDRAMHARGSCDQCRFCGVSNALGPSKEVVFMCRYNPPAVHAAFIMTPEGPAWAGNTSWPNVSKLDWCSRFEPSN